MASKLIVGCGYLGLRIVALWREQGHRIFATTRKPERAEELARLGIEPVICDVLSPPSLGRLPEVDGAVYCVGMDRSAKVSMREVYVEGLRQVLQAMPAPARLVYVSSTGVYGQTTGEEVDEDATTEPLEESGQVVLEAERLLRRYRPDAIVLRFAGIYGPNRLLRAAALRAGTPLAIDPEKWLNLIHVEDGAQAAIRAEENGAPGSVFNVSDDRPVRRREFYTRLAEVLGTPAPHFVPWEESAAHDRANRRIVNARLRRQLGVQLRYPSFLEGLPASR